MQRSAALDHGAGGQLKIAGRDQRKMVQEGQGRGQLPGGTTNPKSTAGVPVLPADAEWRGQEVIIAARVAREPGGVASSGAVSSAGEGCEVHSYLARSGVVSDRAVEPGPQGCGCARGTVCQASAAAMAATVTAAAGSSHHQPRVRYSTRAVSANRLVAAPMPLKVPSPCRARLAIWAPRRRLA